MDVALLEGKEYIPDWNNNKKESEPVKIFLQPLTAGQRAVLLEKIFNGKEEEYLIYACRCAIKTIENLSVAGKQIKTAEEFLDSRGVGLDELVLDIGKEVIVLNKRPDLKNS